MSNKERGSDLLPRIQRRGKSFSKIDSKSFKVWGLVKKGAVGPKGGRDLNFLAAVSCGPSGRINKTVGVGRQVPFRGKEERRDKEIRNEGTRKRRETLEWLKNTGETGLNPSRTISEKKRKREYIGTIRDEKEARRTCF